MLLFHVNAQTSVSVPKLVLLATGTIDIGKPLSPIPIPGGVRVGKIDIPVSAFVCEIERLGPLADRLNS